MSLQQKKIIFLIVFIVDLSLLLPLISADGTETVTQISSLTPLQKQFYGVCHSQNCAASSSSSWKTSSPGRSCSSFCLDSASKISGSSCSDPDFLNVSTKTEVTVSAGPFTKKWEDRCYTFPSGKTYLLEYMCVNDNYGYRQIDCATVGKHFVCNGGRCLPSILNVKQFGARGDGIADDGRAIQTAIDTASSNGFGKIYIPAGTFFIDQTILLRNNTELYGDGEKTILMRGNTKSNVPWYGGVGFCEKNIGFAGRVLFWNSHYNCGNQNISLHDFVIDGSLVTSVPESVSIALSAVENVDISHLIIRNVAQDGIFIRNGGVNTVIHDNIIDGHNLLWNNGGGINIEMHGEGNIPVTSSAPVRIERNTIVVRGPSFCKENGLRMCSFDSDCDTSCGDVSNIKGISATWVGGQFAPVMEISDNIIKVTNSHTAIVCNGCRDSIINSNRIESLSSATQRSGLFSGITSEHPRGGYGRNITVSGNTIIGSGSPGDGRAILLSSNSVDSDLATINENTISNKNILSVLGAISLRGYHDFVIDGNKITEITNGPGIEIGSCSAGWLTTKSGVVSNNEVRLSSGNPALAAITGRNVDSVSLVSNLVSDGGREYVRIC